MFDGIKKVIFSNDFCPVKRSHCLNDFDTFSSGDEWKCNRRSKISFGTPEKYVYVVLNSDAKNERPLFFFYGGSRFRQRFFGHQGINCFEHLALAKCAVRPVGF
jgi:hypothetical protein